jgi:hypothetical protein
LITRNFSSLRVVVVATPRHARMGGEVGKLARIRRLQHFHKHAPRIGMLGHRVGEALGRQVADVGRA